jgi:hypothetical protein
MHPPFYTFKLLKMQELWLRGVDLNHRPLGYELVALANHRYPPMFTGCH